MLMKARVIQFEKTGGPEVLRLETVNISPPGAAEVILRHEAIGVNFIDTYHRSGLYPLPLPSGLGIEAAGVVEAVGPAVDDIAIGDRVAHCSAGIGAYCDVQKVAADCLIPLPDSISTELAAGMMVKGLTAQMLLKQVRPLRSGETILLYAAAGGVGLIAAQWAHSIGARVIGVVGSEAKAQLATKYGCDHVLISGQDNIAEQVRVLTDGVGVPVVYDSVGKDTFQASLDSLAPLGMYVSFGNASGPPPPLDLAELMRRGSLFATRPTFATYVRTAAQLHAAANDLFDRVACGDIKVDVRQRFALADAAEAHRALESRATEGATILIP